VGPHRQPGTPDRPSPVDAAVTPDAAGCARVVPRRPVPAWVTAPPPPPSLSAGGTTASTPQHAPLPAQVPPAQSIGVPASAWSSVPPTLDPRAVIPDFLPRESDLPTAPTSPVIDTRPVAAQQGPAAPNPLLQPPTVPVARDLPGGGRIVRQPRAGQPRFSVPGLEDLVVPEARETPERPVGVRAAPSPHSGTTGRALPGLPAWIAASLPAEPIGGPRPQTVASVTPTGVSPASDEQPTRLVASADSTSVDAADAQDVDGFRAPSKAEQRRAAAADRVRAKETARAAKETARAAKEAARAAKQSAHASARAAKRSARGADESVRPAVPESDSRPVPDTRPAPESDTRPAVPDADPAAGAPSIPTSAPTAEVPPMTRRARHLAEESAASDAQTARRSRLGRSPRP